MGSVTLVYLTIFLFAHCLPNSHALRPSDKSLEDSIRAVLETIEKMKNLVAEVGYSWTDDVDSVSVYTEDDTVPTDEVDETTISTYDYNYIATNSTDVEEEYSTSSTEDYRDYTTISDVTDNTTNFTDEITTHVNDEEYYDNDEGDDEDEYDDDDDDNYDDIDDELEAEYDVGSNDNDDIYIDEGEEEIEWRKFGVTLEDDDDED